MSAHNPWKPSRRRWSRPAKAYLPPTKAPAPSSGASTASMSKTPRKTAAPIATCCSPPRASATAISGVILYDETLRQKSADGTSFVDLLNKNGVLPGIKVDAGAKDTGAVPRRNGHRRARQPAQALRRVREARREVRQVARGDHHRRRTFRSRPASPPMPMRWRVTPPSARKRAWCPSSSPKC